MNGSSNITKANSLMTLYNLASLIYDCIIDSASKGASKSTLATDFRYFEQECNQIIDILLLLGYKNISLNEYVRSIYIE